MFIRKNLAIPLGLLCLTISIMLNRLFGEIPRVAFFEGLFLGLSFTLSIFGLVVIGKQAVS